MDGAVNFVNTLILSVSCCFEKKLKTCVSLKLLKLENFQLGRPKRLLVFVNPFGGKKSAREIFVKEVKPLFEDADVQLEIQGS